MRDCENNSGRKRIGEKEKKGEERRGEEERHTQWRLGRDIALCFLSGQMIYRVSPYIAASYYNPAKTRKGLCESHRESATEGEGGDGVEKERGWSGKASERSTIWEVLHIYGLLVRARKQISGKSW